jgi:hypothetical protein
MAVSGTNSFTVTRNDIIESSLRTLGVIGIGETPQTEDYTNCSQALNIMIKAWAKKGWPLWTVATVEVKMIPGVLEYDIGPTAGYIHSVTISDGGSGYPDSGTVTFSGGGSGATGTYTASGGVLQSVTITAGGSAYTYATTASFDGGGSGEEVTVNVVGVKVNKPVRAFSAFIRNPQNYDTSLLTISKEEYENLGYKFNESIPNQFYYDNQLANGKMLVFNVPQETGYTVHLDVQRMFYDMASSTDNFDFPSEWFQALKWGLCAEVCVEYGVPIDQVQYYESKAMAYIQEAFDFSVEEASVYFQMSFD